MEGYASRYLSVGAVVGCYNIDPFVCQGFDLRFAVAVGLVESEACCAEDWSCELCCDGANHFVSLFMHLLVAAA